MKEETRKKLSEKGVHFPGLIGLVKMGDFHSFKTTLEEHIDDETIHALYEAMEVDAIETLEEHFSTFKGKLDEAGYY